MQNLSKEQKDIILDFYFRCGTDEHINHGRDLIASDERASELYARLEDTLTQLDSVKYEACPDNLAEITVARLKAASTATGKKTRLEHLLHEEHQKPTPQYERYYSPLRAFLANARQVAAVAAVLVVAFILYVPARSGAKKVADCQANMLQISRAVQSYANEHDGALPAVATTAGAPWWKVGQQGAENQSNTRHLWLLVKDGYIEPEQFVCAGRKNALAAKYEKGKLQKLNDFPEAHNISYSFMFMSDKQSKRGLNSKLVLMADKNPVLEMIFNSPQSRQSDYTSKNSINDKIARKMMSSSHAGMMFSRKGQNVLLGDGSVKFQKTRIIFNDDIYMIKQSGTTYQGIEKPCDENDTFLIP